MFGDRRCLPRGMPSMVINEFATEILENPRPDHHDQRGQPLARTISLTRKTHLTDQDPSYNGDSIGHWVGRTLVVETTNLNDSSSHIPGVFGGETAFVPRAHANAVKITERYHLEKGGKLLVNDMTFENPAVLTRPWTVALRLPPRRGRRRALGICLPGGCARLVRALRRRSPVQGTCAEKQ